jgi:hypothetical protein
MFGIKEFSLEFLTSIPIVVALTFLALALLTYWLYRNTNPPLPTWIRVGLATLRSIAVVALIAALLQPVLSFTREVQRQKRIAIVTDASASMDKIEGGKSRLSRVDSLLSTPAFARLIDRTDEAKWYFADHLKESRSALNRDATAVGEALTELNKAELAQPSDIWILLSDGNSNSGRNPTGLSAALSVPVYALDLAGESGNLDLSLADIDYNPVVFVGKSTEIKVKLAWQSAEGKKARVSIHQGARLLDSTTFTAAQGDGFADLTLNYILSDPGQKMLRVSVDTLDGEEVTGNNERTIAVKALKSRLSVLLLTEQPDYELGFLRRYLTQSDKFDIRLVSTGPNAGNLGGAVPSTQAEINRYDLIILHDMPASRLESRKAILASYLSEHGGSIWWLMGPRFAQGLTSMVTTLLPFYPDKSRVFDYAETHAEPVEANLFHPAVRLAEDRTAIRALWSSLPPFRTLVRCDVTDPSSVILATTGDGQSGRLPAMGYRRHGRGKLMATAAGPFWPWGFYNLGIGEDGGAYSRFVDGVTNWLTVQDDFDPLRIVPQKSVFSRGEPVVFDALALDQGYRPIPGAGGRISLIPADGRDSTTISFTDRGEGKFQAEFQTVSPGEYTYHGTLAKGDQRLLAREGKVLVEKYSLEEFDQSGNAGNLMAIAGQSGGGYYSWKDFDKMIGAIKPEPIAETSQAEITIWGKSWLLFLFVGALALEWALRKANHLL